MDSKFDVVLSSHVLERIAPSDSSTHLKSIYNVLNEKGKFILNMPNRVFGPHDVTRIKDFTYTNNLPAMGTHINEMTYTESIKILKSIGFRKFYTYVPIVPIRSVYDKFPKLKLSPKILCILKISKFY